MPLADVLSAMRQIILEPPRLPEDAEARTESIKKLFPALTVEEAIDLAKIDPERFMVYTKSIFIGEGNILENHFPMTFALLRWHWPVVFPQEFSKYQLIKDLNTRYPWKAKDVPTFARNFLHYLENDMRGMRYACPELLDIARLEMCNLEMKRHSEERPADEKPLSDAILSLTVDEVLNLAWRRPACSKALKTEFDVLETYFFFHDNNRTLPKSTEKNKMFGLGGRNMECMPRWLKVGQKMFEAFEASVDGAARPLTVLAEKFLEDGAEGASEEQLFVEFLGMIVELAKAGAIVVTMPETAGLSSGLCAEVECATIQ